MTGSSEASWYDDYSDPWKDYKILIARSRKKFLKSRIKGAELVAGLNELIPKFLEAECPQYAGLCLQKVAELSSQNGLVPTSNGAVVRPTQASPESLMHASQHYLACCRDESLSSISKHHMLTYYSSCVHGATQCYVSMRNNIGAFKCVLQGAVAIASLTEETFRCEATPFFRSAIGFANAVGDPKIKVLAYKWLVVSLLEEAAYVEATQCVGALLNLAVVYGSAKNDHKSCSPIWGALVQDGAIMTTFLLLITGVKNVYLSESQQNLWSYLISKDNILHSSNPEPPTTLKTISEDLLIILKSYCLAIDESDYESARFCVDAAWPHLSVIQKDLILKSFQLCKQD